MDANSPLPIIACVLIALFVTWLLSKTFRKKPLDVQFTSVDGLRGFLAFFVMIHHAWIWLYYLKTKEWTLHDSPLYIFFGKGSVSLFFMITGFLFFRKLIDKRGTSFDWQAFYVARIMRLGPVYLASLLTLFLLVAIHSNFQLKVSFFQLANEAWHWFSFGAFGITNMNEVPEFGSIHANVIWSLTYEWVFYLALPVFALLFFRIRSPDFIMLIILVLIGLIFIYNDLWCFLFILFLSGAVAALLSTWKKFCSIASSHFSSIIVVAALFLSIEVFPNSYSLESITFLTIAFIFIVCGNSLFGLLTLKCKPHVGPNDLLHVPFSSICILLHVPLYNWGRSHG